MDRAECFSGDSEHSEDIEKKSLYARIEVLLYFEASAGGGRQEGGPRIHAAQIYALSNINAMSQNRLLIISPLIMPRAASKFGARDLLTTSRRWEARRFWVANAIDINCPTMYSCIKLSMPFRGAQEANG
jgi:hypothetical protein